MKGVIKKGRENIDIKGVREEGRERKAQKEGGIGQQRANERGSF